MKPKPLIKTYIRPDGSKGKTEIASVFSDFYSEDFAEEGDPISCRHDIKLFGDHLLDGYGPKDQIKISRRLAEWLLRYAEWLEYRFNKQEKLNISIKD